MQRLLQTAEADRLVVAVGRLPGRRAVNPLFSFFCSTDPKIRWRAITAMGAVVAGLAETDMESARIVMRRLMWTLNDESGGIGWGAPEAMGETMARHPRLAEEYASILTSYVRPAGNFIEHPELQKGVLWGLGRLAHVDPEPLRDAASLLGPFLRADHATTRGLAAWTAAALPSKATRRLIERLLGDPSPLILYRAGQFVDCTVSQLAAAALMTSRTA